MLMVQSKPTAVKGAKLKPPPPVPPRPSQNVVAEALAKTRKAVAENKKKPDAKAKTLERTAPQTSPKLNGLARVKSFIRDVISDRSATDDRRSTARRGSTESVQLRAQEPRTGRTIKSCRQAIVRSLSTSTKSEPENKRLKASGSFAEKAVPLRRAPPPPLSPKPKLRYQTSKRNSAEIASKPKALRTPPVNASVPTTPASTPPIPSPVRELVTEAPYATVEEVTDSDDRLSPAASPDSVAEVAEADVDKCDRATTLERKTSRVTERLISEIIASRNKKDANSVIDKGKADDLELVEDESKFRDMSNHEKLIFELQTMRSQSRESEDHTATSSPDTSVPTTPEDILDVDPLATDESQDPLTSRLRAQFRAISSMSLAGLPPLPKSLSGFAEGPLARLEDSPPPLRHQPSGPEQQIAYLKKEMASLRRLDLSLLSELWALNESMAAWRMQLERAPAPRLRPAPPPPPHHYIHT